MRLIDADALIEEIAKTQDLRTLSTKTIGEAIDRVPSAVGQQWIPCSERLPSAEHNFKGFLTTIKCYVENDVFIQVYENGKFGHWDGEKLIQNDDVIAWMEMPEPYTEIES